MGDDTCCEHCGRQRPLMVAMEPGSDGKPWRLCFRCWVDGLRSMHVSKDETAVIPATPVAVTPVLVAPAPKAPKKPRGLRKSA